jgi:hypothetical protein
MSRPSPDCISLLPSLNAGTILSCPQCGMGLYMLTKKVTRDGTFEGSVKALAGVPEYARGSLPKKCPLCQIGEWWYPPGTVHTLQHGWVS